jgi:hypothetical protein
VIGRPCPSRSSRRSNSPAKKIAAIVTSEPEGPASHLVHPPPDVRDHVRSNALSGLRTTRLVTAAMVATRNFAAARSVNPEEEYCLYWDAPFARLVSKRLRPSWWL